LATIVMISSRTADKHRDHAFSLGVSHFLGKPYEEGELLRLVKKLGSVQAQTLKAALQTMREMFEA
jgi:PleD family two-component response regulator